MDERADPCAGVGEAGPKFTPKIGYPDKWRDYSALEIDAARPARQRRLRSAEFELDRELAKSVGPSTATSG